MAAEMLWRTLLLALVAICALPSFSGSAIVPSYRPPFGCMFFSSSLGEPNPAPWRTQQPLCALNSPPGAAGTAQHGGEHGAAEEGAAEEGGEEGGHGTTESGEELTGVHGGIGDTILPPGGMFCILLIVFSLVFAFCFSKYLEKSPKMSRGYAQPSGDETASLTKGGAAPIE